MLQFRDTARSSWVKFDDETPRFRSTGLDRSGLRTPPITSELLRGRPVTHQGAENQRDERLAPPLNRVVRAEKDGEAANDQAGYGADEDHFVYVLLCIPSVLKMFRFAIAPCVVVLCRLEEVVLGVDPLQVLFMKRCLGLQALGTEFKVRLLLALTPAVRDDDPLQRRRR